LVSNQRFGIVDFGFSLQQVAKEAKNSPHPILEFGFAIFDCWETALWGSNRCP
jgi:hypothetical protein